MKKTEKQIQKIQQDIAGLLEAEYPSKNEHERIHREMLLNLGVIISSRFDTAELRLMNTLFKELRYALSVFKRYRQFRKAAVFGSARTPQKHADYQLAKQFGRKLARKGWMIITGGASGIMEAAMAGAGAKFSFGLNIMLPFEQKANPIITGNRKLMYFKYFFIRKLIFLKESDATVLFPGGFGTFDEGFESFTLVQTGKAKPRPLIVIDPPGAVFWKSIIGALRRNMERSKFVSPGDFDMIRHYHDADKAVNEIVNFHSNYHSSRFFKSQYLIRLWRPLSEKKLAQINRRFKDILSHGGFERFKTIEEDDEKDPSLERLIFRFNRSDYSRLRQLIDYLNAR